MTGVATARVWDALNDTDPEESAERTKDAVADILNAADPSASILRTPYFNNSCQPDLVMNWNSDSRQTRLVYLRPTQDINWLRDDVELAGESNCTFISLESLLDSDTSNTESRALDATARETESLVTEVESIEALVDASHSGRPGASLVAPAAVRGGLGVINEASARDLVNGISDAFVGAQVVDREATAVGVEYLHRFLKSSQSSMLDGVLQAVWSASGGFAGDYPSDEPKLDLALDANALQLLLSLEKSEDEGFWKRVSRATDFKLLTSINLPEGVASRGLQRLMQDAVNRLVTRCCVIRPEPEAAQPFTWSVSDGCLVLRGHEISAWFANRREDVKVDPHDGTGPSFSLLADRAARGHVLVDQLQVTDGDRVLTYESRSQQNVLETGEGELARWFGSTANLVSVSRARALINLVQRRLDVDFERMSAAGRTNVQLALGEIAWASIMLLTDAPIAAIGDLERVLNRTGAQTTVEGEDIQLRTAT